jgi:hypothetical protein
MKLRGRSRSRKKNKRKRKNKVSVSLMQVKFKTYRQYMFLLGKTIKYAFWACSVLLAYHMYLVRKTDKPEEGLLAIDKFLKAARFIDWSISDIYIVILFT